MCFNRRPPTPPPLPDPRPTAPRPEETAKNVVTGSSRTGQGNQKRSNRKRKPLGTESLRIPVTNSSDLRY